LPEDFSEYRLDCAH